MWVLCYSDCFLCSPHCYHCSHHQQYHVRTLPSPPFHHHHYVAIITTIHLTTVMTRTIAITIIIIATTIIITIGIAIWCHGSWSPPPPSSPLHHYLQPHCLLHHHHHHHHLGLLKGALMVREKSTNILEDRQVAKVTEDWNLSQVEVRIYATTQKYV